MQPRLEPASSIIRKLGGNAKVAEIAGIHPGRVSYWMVARDKGGTGGTIPYRHIEPLIKYARANGIRLRPADFAMQLEQE